MSSSEQHKHIRVMIVDDHDLVRKSIIAMLDRESGMDVVGSAVNGREAIALAQTLEPDVIVMDISMPELDGIRATGEIMALDISTEVVLLSMHHNSTLVQQAQESGAAAYVLKQDANISLIPAIRAANETRLSD
jgi:DNA-binding NarL/FixJ family response regulator